MTKQEMIDTVNSVIETTMEFGFKVFAIVNQNNGLVMKKFKVTDQLSRIISSSICRVIREKYLGPETEVDSIDNIGDNRNVLYSLDQDDEYKPFGFVSRDDNTTTEFTAEDYGQLRGFVFRFNLNETVFYAYQKVYGMSFISPAKGIYTFLNMNRNTFDNLQTDVLRINHAVDVLIIGTTLIVKNIALLQAEFGFDKKVRRDAQQSLESINTIGIIANSDKLQTFIEKERLTNAKKFMKVKNSPVLRMEKERLVQKIKAHHRYSTMFQFDDQDRIEIKNIKDIGNLLSMLNDDYLRSELTDSEYDSQAKKMLPPTGTQG